MRNESEKFLAKSFVLFACLNAYLCRGVNRCEGPASLGLAPSPGSRCMGTSGPNRRGSFDLGEVAPFWLPTADADGVVISDLVRDAAKELWPWAFRHVQKGTS